jgi:hypothetical protein
MEEVEKWVGPEKFRAKSPGIFALPGEKQIPHWQLWKERWEEIEKRKKEKKINNLL